MQTAEAQKWSRWSAARKDAEFRKKLVIGLVLLVCALGALPFFFQHNELRQGFSIYDPVLAHVSPRDVSIPIFAAIWSATLLMLVRSLQNPRLMLTAVYGFALLCLVRMGTITALPLDPPDGLVPLVDPISNSFYGKSFIKRDLFFSGHTATLCLFFFCFQRKNDKLFSLLCTIAVGLLVLVQHVHYTVDVLAAPVFTFLCYKMSKKIVDS